MSTRIAAAFVLLTSSHAVAGRAQPRFEPTDLELEQTGVVDIDLQLGPVRGQGPWRLVTPDFELDLGVLPWLELDLDGAYAFEGATPGSMGATFFDHAAPDNLWLSAKLGIADWHDRSTDRAFALGVQAGPKLPVANDTSGIGLEALALVGIVVGRTHLVLNLGGLVDPRVTGSRARGLEGGIDLEVEIVPDRWSLLGEIGGVHYVSADPDQLSATLGIQYSPSEMLDVAIVGLVGVLSGSDQYGLLVGVSPKLALFSK